MLARDKDGDGKLTQAKCMGLDPARTSSTSTSNKDGLLDAEELKAVSKWLNTHHAPGVPEKALPDTPKR